MAHVTFEHIKGYEVGDRISMVVHRGWLAIWWDRIRLRRWNVPQTETKWFKCKSTSIGSIWQEGDE